MPIKRSSSLLRNLLLLDAATCALMGAALTLGSDLLAAVTAIPAVLLLCAGTVLFPTAAFMAVVAMWALGSRPAVGLIIAGNILWAGASLWLMLSGWIAPNALGHAFIAPQALAVALFATLEHMAFRRTWAAAAA